MPKAVRLPLSASAVATLVCMVWGGNVVAVHQSLLELPPFAAAAARSALAGTLLLGWALLTGASLRIQATMFRPLCMLSILTIGIVACFYLAIARTAASHAAILVYAHPIFTALLAHRHLPGERLSAGRTLGLVLGFTGMAITLYSHDRNISRSTLGGDALALLSAVVWAIYTIETKRAVVVIPVHHLAVYPTLVAAVAFAALSAAFEQYRAAFPSPLTLSALGYQGLLATGAGNVVWFLLLRRYPASILSAHTFLTPLFGVLASAALLNETLSAELLLGLCLIVFGLERLSSMNRPSPSPRPHGPE